MNLESGVRYVLTDDTDVAALVGTRVYSGILPQNPTYPAVTIQPITEDDNNTLASRPALRWARLQIDAWAETYAGAKDLHDKVRAFFRLIHPWRLFLNSRIPYLACLPPHSRPHLGSKCACSIQAVETTSLKVEPGG